ncbi:hypothetical protein IEO21_09772 [Rhodonia placenta]|uniref:Uncharacterized protein n=1 Tax=Rhodonia placenta TaxID=104341 RepID=A0A8H7TXE3_9APHY|nr:hypothetical protein IEO21_09772 [Postia placenta]
MSPNNSGHILGGCIIESQCVTRQSSLIQSRRKSQHMGRAAVHAGLILGHLGAQYVNYLECEAEERAR